MPCNGLQRERQSSVAVSEMSVFRTRLMGQFAFASRAIFWKVSLSIFGTDALVVKWIFVIVQLPSTFSRLKSAFVATLFGGKLFAPSIALSAMEKQAAWAAAINSSGLVPG